jgi:hypothetical protein
MWQAGGIIDEQSMWSGAIVSASMPRDAPYSFMLPNVGFAAVNIDNISPHTLQYSPCIYQENGED